MLRFERQYWDSGCRDIAGVDEAGRGPLAGPVVAAAVVIKRSFAEEEEHGALAGLTDSKRLSRKRRELFFAVLNESPHVRIGVGIADVDEIDTLNILGATRAAISRAVNDLVFLPDHILLDGLPMEGLPSASTAIVKGDSKSLSIAAASVIAKVTRDARMRELHREYPHYGFDRHKGYGSRAHVQALFEHGPCPVHRRSFRPVMEAENIRRRTGPGGEAHDG